jgi:hypothetical protein
VGRPYYTSSTTSTTVTVVAHAVHCREIQPYARFARKLKRDGDFDDNAPSWRFKQVSHGYVSVKKRLTSSKSYTSTLTTSRSKDVTQEKVIKQTRLNTRLTTALNGVFEVVYLEDALTVEALFAEVIQAWRSKIKDERKGAILSVVNVHVIIE